MSYDLQIWSVNPISLSAEIFDKDGWQKDEFGWVLPSRNWQIIAEKSLNVLAEDIPMEINRLLPGIQYLSSVTLEPTFASESARKKSLSVTKQFAKEAHGVVYDLQTEEFFTPRGIKRYIPPTQADTLTLLQMSWWFVPGQHSNRQSLEALVELMERYLPESIPRRYGPIEPPQYLYEETGKSHFLDFLEDEINGFPIWYGHKPVLTVSFDLNQGWGASSLGYRANYLQINIDHAALTQPGWEITLRNFWQTGSQLIEPFFGDVRLLHNYARGRGGFYVQADSEGHPVYGPWWNGVPKSLGQAAVIGKPYISLWPSLAENIQIEDNLAFATLEDWTNSGDAVKLVGGVPKDIAQPRIGNPVVQKHVWGQFFAGRLHYPKTWPFEGPYNDK